jgi:anti-sigma factor RsiW
VSHLGHRLSALIDGELGDAERDRALVHLARCDECRLEAVDLRRLKLRMSALGGELSADSAFTHRLMDLAQAGSAFAAESPFASEVVWPHGTVRGGLRDIRPAWYVALGCSAIFLTSAGTAAFMAGGAVATPAAPQVTPQVDQYLTQYDLTNGVAPVTSTAGPAADYPATVSNLTPDRRASRTPAGSSAPVQIALRTAQLPQP